MVRTSDGPGQMSVREVSRLMHFERDDLARVKQVLRIPALAPDWRRPFEDAVAAAGG